MRAVGCHRVARRGDARAPPELPELFATAEAVGGDDRGWISTHRGKQHALCEGNRQIILRALESECACHAAAAAIQHVDLMSRGSQQADLGFGGERRRLLTVPVVEHVLRWNASRLVANRSEELSERMCLRCESSGARVLREQRGELVTKRASGSSATNGTPASMSSASSSSVHPDAFAEDYNRVAFAMPGRTVSSSSSEHSRGPSVGTRPIDARLGVSITARATAASRCGSRGSGARAQS